MRSDEFEVFAVLTALSVLGLGSLLLRDFVISILRRGWREREDFKSRWFWPLEPLLICVIAVMFYSGTGWMILSFPLFFLTIALFLMRTGTGGLARDQAWCLHSLALTARAGLPSPESLRGIAADIRGRFGLALLAASERVQLGGSISEAFSAYAVFPPHVIAAIRIAEAGGGKMMAATLRSLKTERQFLAELRGQISYRLLLPLASLCFTISAGAFLSVFIFPKQREIFKALRIKSTSIHFAMDLSNLLLAGSGLILLSLVAYMLLAGNAPTRFKQGVSELIAQMYSRLPLLSRYSLDVDLMRALPALAVQLECGVSVPQSLRNIATPDICRLYTLDFLRAANHAENGDSLGEALKKAGFAESLCMLVSSTRTPEQLAFALNTEAQVCQRRVQRFENLMTALVPISIILFVGLVQFVLIVCTWDPINTLHGALLRK